MKKKAKKVKTIKTRKKKLDTGKLLKQLDKYSKTVKNILPMIQYLNQTIALLSHPQINNHIDNEKRVRKIYTRLRSFNTELDSLGDLVNKSRGNLNQHLINKDL